MCGITGFISKTIVNPNEVIINMTDKIYHRGPDSNGNWISEDGEIVLGHTRLSILDLSDSGSQPMTSHSGRYVIVFNGEIYNNQHLKAIVENDGLINWRGHSDTEIFIQSIEVLGLELTLKESNGMFAFAIWDKKMKSLTIARDRLGEKPLYYGKVNENFVFASDLASIEAFPGFENKIDRDALTLYFRYSAIPAPYSIYEGIKKLTPGCYVNIIESDFESKENAFYDIKNDSKSTNLSISPDDAVEKLDNLLSNAVQLQMQSDVPTGAFLSGGVDSSTVAALMQKQSKNSISTFSIGFDERKYNEAEYAKEVAKHLKTNHHDLYVTAKEVLNVIPELPCIYNEPFSDSSQIPTFLVSKIAKEKVTVCLTGDAGDELFCGYSRYKLAQDSWNKISKVPIPIRRLVSASIKNVPRNFAQNVFPAFNSINSHDRIDKFYKAADLLKEKNRVDFYHNGFLAHNYETESLVLGGKVPLSIYNSDLRSLKLDGYMSEMMLLDLMSYLPTDNLAKVDRASMAVSLETRIPMLDKNVVAFAQSLPLNLKYRNGVDKWVLREVLYKYVPQNLIDRPKMGFAVPLSDWIKGPLKDWGEELLNEKLLEEQGLFNVSLVRKKWDEHHKGLRNWQYQLWDLLNFQSWYFSRK